MRNLPKGYNRHHTCFERRAWLADPVGRLVMQSPGMIVVMPIVDQNRLHALVPPPRVPSEALGDLMLGVLDDCKTLPRFDQFVEVKQTLWRVAEGGFRVSDEAFELVMNFEDQTQFLEDALKQTR